MKIWIGREIECLIPSGATYASNTQCRQMYVQISCLSVQSDGISSVLRTVRMARVATSLVMAIPNGQVMMVVSAGISFSAITLWPEGSGLCDGIE